MQDVIDWIKYHSKGVLVVSGSRTINDSSKPAHAVIEAKKREWAILIGDASGVDFLTIRTAVYRGVWTVILGCEAVGAIRNPVSQLLPTVSAYCKLIPGNLKSTK